MGEGNSQAGSEHKPLQGWLLRYLQAVVHDPLLVRARQRYVPLKVDASRSSKDPTTLSDVLRSSGHIVLLGDVGAGKTSLLQATAYDYGYYRLNVGHTDVYACTLCDERRIPVYIELGGGDCRPLANLFQVAVQARLSETIDLGEIERALRDEDLLIMVDGFEFVRVDRHLDYLRCISDAVLAKYPHQSYVISCRSHEISSLQPWFADVAHVFLQALDDEDVARFTTSDLGERQAQDVMQRLGVDREWWELARNPMVLEALCSVAREAKDFTSTSTAKLVVSLTDVLAAQSVRGWDRTGPCSTSSGDRPDGFIGTNASARAEADAGFVEHADRAKVSVDAATIDSCLAALATTMQRAGTRSVTREQLLEAIQELLPGHGTGELVSEAWPVLVNTGIVSLDQSRGQVTFSSVLFRHHYGAMALRKALATGRSLAEVLHSSAIAGDWEGSLVLLYGLTEDRQRFLRELVGQGDRYENVLLAVRCLMAEHPTGGYRRLVRLDPLNVQVHRAFGRAFRQIERFDEARQALEDAVRLEPNQATIHQELAAVLVEQGRFEQASKEFQTACRLSGNQMELHLGLGAIHLRQKRWAEARGEIDIAEEHLRLDQAEIYHLRGHVCEGEGLLAEAHQEYCQAICLSASPHLWFHAGAVRRRLGERESALEALVQAVQLWPDSVEAHRELGLLHESQAQYEPAVHEYRLAARLQPEAAENYINLGRVHRKLGKMAQAAAELGRAISLHGSSHEAYAELGLVFEHRGQHEEALAQYRHARQLAPERAEYYQRVGWVLRVMGRLSEAEVELGISVKLDPSEADYRDQLGAILAEQARFVDALEQYTQAVALRPHDPVHHHNVGAMLARLGNYQAAIPALMEAVRLSGGSGDGRSASSELALSTAVVAADAHSELGLVYEKIEQHDKALYHYRRSADLMPLSEAYWLRQGLVYRRLSRHDRALTAIKHAVALAPEDADLRLELGATYELLHDLESALREFARAIDLRPDEAGFRIRAATVFSRLGRFEQAEEQLGRALDLQPRSAEAHAELGRLRVEKGDVERGLGHCLTALEIEPDNASFHLAASQGFRHAGQLEEAIKEAERAAELSADLAEVWFQLAQLHAETGSAEKAARCAQRAANLDETSPVYARLAGQHLSGLGRAEDAIVYLRRAAEGEPNKAEAHFALAAALAKTGRLEDALAEYEQACTHEAGSVTYLLRLGECLLRLGRPGDAVGNLLKAVTIDPGLEDGHAMIARGLAELGKHRAALDRLRLASGLAPMEARYFQEMAAIQMALEEWSEAAESARQAMRLGCQEAALHHILGKAVQRQGAWQEASDALARAVESAQSVAAFDRDLAMAHCRLGSAESAAERLARAVAREENVQWRCELGCIQDILGRPETALVHFERLAPPIASSTAIQRKLGLLYWRFGRSQPAIVALEEVDKRGDADGTVRVALGSAYTTSGQFEPARVQLEMALAEEPDSPVLHTTIAALYRTMLAAGQHKMEEHGRPTLELTVESLNRALNLDPGYAEAQCELGRLHETTGADDKALDQFRKALSLKPTEPAYRCLAAETLLRLGRPDEALALVQEALDRGQTHPALSHQLGRVLERKEVRAEALASYQQAADLAPDNAQYRYDLGMLKHRLGRRDAQSDVAQAIRMMPNRPDWHCQLGHLIEKQGDATSALEEYRQAAAGAPKVDEYHRSIGRVLRLLSRLDESIEALQMALSLNRSAQNLTELSITRQRQGHFQEALRCAQQATKLDPGNPISRLRVAVALKLTGQRAKAAEDMESVVKQSQQFADGHYELGNLLEEDGRVEEALRHYQKAVELEPGDSVHLCALARGHRTLGQLDLAGERLSRAVTLSPRSATVYHEMAKLSEARSRYAEALASYQRAIELDPRTDFHRDLAKLLQTMGKTKEALAAMRKVVDREPRIAQWQSDLGDIYDQQGAYDQAIGQYQRAIRLDAHNPEFHRNLGVALKKAGKYEDAMVELQRALELKPDYADAYRHLTAASASALLRKTIKKDK
ncbi:MAG: tetratricopeptide repeat protein [Chloroflexi bacterium]|nr:tetratricopeptide repeat protein [Chloroflexota bacterium]